MIIKQTSQYSRENPKRNKTINCDKIINVQLSLGNATWLISKMIDLHKSNNPYENRNVAIEIIERCNAKAQRIMINNKEQ